MDLRERKLNRLPGFDYSSPGAYFVTICTKDRINWFGEIKNKRIELNVYGNVVSNTWSNIPKYYENVLLDEWIIMPNHLHGIIHIVGDEHCSSPTGKNNYGLISKIVKSFKEITLKTIRMKFKQIDFTWQRSFYDHIIRNEYSLFRIQEYIRNNPVKWELDRYYK